MPTPGERELRHVGAADQGSARGAQASNRGCIDARRRRAAQDRRAGGGHLAGDIEQVLDRDGEAGQRPGIAPGGDRLVGGRGGGTRGLGTRRDEGRALRQGSPQRRSRARSSSVRRRSPAPRSRRRASVRSSAIGDARIQRFASSGRATRADRSSGRRSGPRDAEAATSANRLSQGVAASIERTVVRSDSSRILEPTFGSSNDDHDA